MAGLASTPSRRLALLLAVALALWAYRASRSDGDPAVADAVVGATSRPTLAAAGAQPRASADGAALREPMAATALANPFIAPPPPPPPAPPPPPRAKKEPPAPPPPPVVPPPPQLPYRVIGLFEEPGQPKTVFLANSADQLVVARPGDLVDGAFRLEAIEPKAVVFVHLQRQYTLRLPWEESLP